jgi:hypothetical protein
VTTTQISLQEPIISSCHDLNVWRVLEVSCYRTRTKGGRKTALNPLVHSNARRIFNPMSQSNYPCNKPYFERVRELSVSFEQGDGNGKTSEVSMVRP